MQNPTELFIYIFFKIQKFKFCIKNQRSVSAKKIIHIISEKFINQETEISDFILFNEDIAFTEMDRIDFSEYNRMEFALIIPSEMLAKKKSSDEQKEKERLKNKNVAQNKAALSSLIAKATNAKVEMQIKKPVGNLNQIIISSQIYRERIINNYANNIFRASNIVNNNPSMNNILRNSNNNNNINISSAINNNNIINFSANLNNNRNGIGLSNTSLNRVPILRNVQASSPNSFGNLYNFNWNPEENEEQTEEEKFEASVSILIEMGFECEEAKRVLCSTKNNLDKAIVILVHSRRDNA